MRIALTHVYAWPEVRRGGERYLHELGAALLDAGHQVAITTTAPAPGADRQLGVPVRRLRRRHVLRRRLGGLADEAAFSLQAAAHLGWRRLDVWHALGTADAAVAALAGRTRPLRSVYTSLGLPERGFRDGRPDRCLHDMVVRHVDSYVCLSEVGTRMLAEGYGRRGVTVHGGVDTRRFLPAPRRHASPVLLFASAVEEPRKGLAMLLEAVDLLLPTHPGLELWLSGPGDPSAILAAAPPAARCATRVVGLGHPEDQAGLYAAAWATVLPAHHEAFGLVLVESLACGTPIVALDDGYGASEVVAPGTGALAGPGPDGLAAACAEALDLAAGAATASHCRDAAMAYDWRRAIVPALERVYEGAGT